MSSNTAVERCGAFGQVVRTRIGSPYVIAAMSEAALRGEGPVVARGERRVPAGERGPAQHRPGRGDARGAPDARRAPAHPLPARDGGRRRPALSQLTAGLPARYTASDRVQAFPTALSRRPLDHLAASPEALREFFGELGEVAGVDRTDGVRVTLASGDIVHLM